MLVNALLNALSGEVDLKKLPPFQTSQNVMPSKKMRTGMRLPNPKRGIKRHEAPVDKNQINTILLICAAENIFVIEGNPADS